MLYNILYPILDTTIDFMYISYNIIVNILNEYEIYKKNKPWTNNMVKYININDNCLNIKNMKKMKL